MSFIRTASHSGQTNTLGCTSSMAAPQSMHSDSSSTEPTLTR